jgi:hypothetical protein
MEIWEKEKRETACRQWLVSCEGRGKVNAILCVLLEKQYMLFLFC